MLTILGLILSNNIVLQFMKKVTDYSLKRWELRLLLAVFSLLGVFSTVVLSGDRVDFDSVAFLVGIIIECITVGFGSHFSYKLMAQPATE